MFIIKIIELRPSNSNSYPLKVKCMLSAKVFHIRPTNIHYSHDEMTWNSETIEKGETVQIINADTGNILETYKRI